MGERDDRRAAESSRRGERPPRAERPARRERSDSSRPAPRGRVPSPEPVPRVSLARAISKLGYASRSRGRSMVVDGRVAVNGHATKDPDLRVDPARDRITVDGVPLVAARRVYLAVNKPRGVVTTAADEKGRRTVYELLPPELPWVGPVGRLDMASEGLLLLTNDSRWADRVSLPASHLDKVYRVQVDRLADDALLRALERGVQEAGELLAAKRATLLRIGARNSWIEVTLDEGRNRQIRRMLATLGVEVLRLVRVAVGPLMLGELPKGAWRELTALEKQAIDDALGPRREGR